jgi:hypothetical protein
VVIESRAFVVDGRHVVGDDLGLFEVLNPGRHRAGCEADSLANLLGSPVAGVSLEQIENRHVGSVEVSVVHHRSSGVENA